MSKRASSRPKTIRCRGRVLSPRRIEGIRKLIRSHPEATRRELSFLVCRAWRWRRPNGELRLRACRDLLLRLDEQRYIKLPPPRTAYKRRRRPRSPAESDHGEALPAALASEDIDLSSVVVRPITRGELGRWRETMARFHYLGDGEIVGESLRYVAESGGRWLALLGWGAAVLKSRHREAYVGWDEKRKYQRLHLVADNVRFLILPWVRRPRLASRVLGENLRRLSADWEARYGHPILLVETFVDLKRFRGTCYRASNWCYLGETRGMKRKGAGFEEHGEKKGLFLYTLHRRAREILSAPFPSPEVLRRPRMRCMVDVNQLPLLGKGGLVEVLRGLTDPRKPQGIRHPFESVLALAVMAVLSGMRAYETIAEWAADVPKEVLKGLRCWCHQAPSEPTFRRVLGAVDAQEVDKKVYEWLAEREKLGAVALDGKTLRGSGDGDEPAWHLLSAVTHDGGVVVAQERVDGKTNEIKVTKPLLEDLDLEGSSVTADAMHTQKDFVRYLVEEKGADYVLLVKDNQPTLREDIEAVDWGSFFPSGEHSRQGARADREPPDVVE